MSTNASTSSTSAFSTPNPHALATILEAAETKRIIAATDIFDISGIKLWAAKQPVSAELQRRLLDRKLREPLESCLIAEDGVNSMTLIEAVQQLAESGDAVAPVVRAQAARLVKEAAHLPLHPAAQLLLTAGQASRPASFEHAIKSMSLAGALVAAQGGDTPEIRVAMLCGLLHDLGEMYIDPLDGEAQADRDLDLASYQQLVVHPHVGYLLLAQLTNYPRTIAQAVAQHHERMDGSGYPHAITGAEITPLGRMLAVVEAALNAMRSPYDRLLRASVALRAVPGEFDLAWVGKLSRAATAEAAQPPAMEHGDIEARLKALAEVLTAAETSVATQQAAATHPHQLRALELAAYLLQRLRAGWNESGMWNPNALASGDAAEVEALEDEIYFRLRGVQRATLLRAGELPPTEAAQLAQLCDSLAMGTTGED